MSKKNVKPKKDINWEVIVPWIVVLVIVSIIGTGIFTYASGSDERAAIAQVKYDLSRNQNVQLIIHQPNMMEIHYEYIETVHNGRTYSEKERRFLINAKYIVNISYNYDNLFIKSNVNQRNYTFRNISYKEWNEAFLQLEDSRPIDEILEEGED